MNRILIMTTETIHHNITHFKVRVSHSYLNIHPQEVPVPTMANQTPILSLRWTPMNRLDMSILYM